MEHLLGPLWGQSLWAGVLLAGAAGSEASGDPAGSSHVSEAPKNKEACRLLPFLEPDLGGEGLREFLQPCPPPTYGSSPTGEPTAVHLA